MAGIQFLSKILGLTGLIIRKNGSNRQVTIDLSSSQVPDTSLNVYLPYQNGTILISPATAGTSGEFLITNGDGTTSWTTLDVQAGSVLSTAFSGNPKTATVTMPSAMPSTSYSVAITGNSDLRSWTVESKTTTTFVINSNSDQSLSGSVDWIVVNHGAI
jgi:hypothetical protein